MLYCTEFKLGFKVYNCVKSTKNNRYMKNFTTVTIFVAFNPFNAV